MRFQLYVSTNYQVAFGKIGFHLSNFVTSTRASLISDLVVLLRTGSTLTFRNLISFLHRVKEKEKF